VNSQFEDRSMAKDIDKAGDGAAASPESGSDKSTAKAELPQVDSPPLSPGEAEHTEEVEQAAAAETETTLKPPQTAIALIPAPVVTAPDAEPGATARIIWSPRRKRAVLLAASVAFAAALGAVVGAVSSGGFATPAPRNDVAGSEESKAMQKSIAHLSKEVASLKSSLEAASKAAHSQVAKMGDKIGERLASSAQDITGSISAPQTVAPLPTPRPILKQEPRIAAVETQSPTRPAVVQDWTIRAARGGFVFVEGHGEIYQVVPGAPLPGLGPVQTIAQRDGRWVVVTPRGIIVSMRDRRYFEQF
jgi:hypothetical protein